MNASFSLLKAVNDKDLAQVRRSIEQGEDIEQLDDVAFTPLMHAAYDNSMEIASVLLTHGANVHAQDEDGWTPIAYAIGNGNLDMACLLLDHGANADVLLMEMPVEEDEIQTFEEPLEKIICRASGLQVWQDWQARLLDRATPSVETRKKIPRL